MEVVEMLDNLKEKARRDPALRGDVACYPQGERAAGCFL